MPNDNKLYTICPVAQHLPFRKNKKENVKMIYSKKITCFILIFLLSLTLSGVVKAQNIGPNEIENALERTDQVINKAKEIVNESRSQKARVTLEKALDLQRSAKESGTDSKKYTISYKLTMAARNQANRAIALAKTETRMVEQHRRVFERTHERLNNLNGRLMETGTKDMRTYKLVRDAETMLEKSHTNITQMRNQLALKLALNAQKMVSNAENGFRKTNNLRKMCLRRLSLMKRLTSLAGNQVDGSMDQKNKNQLEMANNQLEKAKSFYKEGRYNACRITIVKSEKSMRSLMNNINPADENRIQAMLKQTWTFYKKTSEAIETSEGSATGKQFLKQAEKILKQAEKNAQNGNQQQAKELIIRARSILRKGSATAGPQLSGEGIEAKLKQLETKNVDIKIVIENCSRDESKALYTRAIKHLNKAHEYVRNGNLKSASAEVKITNNLFDRITEICSI
jgi:HEPN domain-containing protein